MSWCIFAEVHGWLTWLVNTWQHYCFFKRMWFEVCDPKIVFLPEQDTTTTAQGYIQNVYTAMNALLLSGTQWDWAYWTKAKKDGFDGINLSVVDQNFNIRSNYAVWPYVQVCCDPI